MTRTNRRGQAQYLLENGFRIGLLMVALLAFFLVINTYIISKTDTNKLQAEVIAARIMYSDTLTYEKNSVIYQGIIDMNRFNDDNLAGNINYTTKRHAGVRIELVNTSNDKTIKTIYVNKAQYDNLYVLSKSGAKGKGGATVYDKYYPVTYVTGREYAYGTIKMRIIIPNS